MPEPVIHHLRKFSAVGLLERTEAIRFRLSPGNQGIFKLDDAQVAYFLDRYSRMTDEELSFLVVTRGDSLSEEASHALRIVLDGRDPSGIRNELKATAADVGAQIQHASAEAKKQEKSARHMRMGVRIASLSLLVIGIFALMLGRTDGGAALCAVGFGMFLYFEIRALIWRFFVALFNPNSR